MRNGILAVSKNDEYYTPAYAITPLMPYLEKFETIWCPFDTDKSYFVKLLRDAGHKVINTHISRGGNFFELNLDCDAIVSNPPYSLKTEVLERLFYLQKPFAMLLGIVGIFESYRRFNLFRRNEFEVLYFDKRVQYYSQYDSETTDLCPPFSSAYVCHKVLPSQIEFAEITKNVKTAKGVKDDTQISLFDEVTA